MTRYPLRLLLLGGLLAAALFLLAARSYEPDMQRVRTVTVEAEDTAPHGAPA